jgi:hypothetical protein
VWIPLTLKHVAALSWIVDYGAVRDFGQGGADSKFIVPADGPLVQIPRTGVIFRICPQ